MSLPTPATDAFLARWLPGHTRPNLLVHVALAVPTALDLYFTLDPAAMRGTAIADPPGGHPWQPVILSTDPVQDAPGADFLAAGPLLATFGFTIANTRLIPQSEGTASDLMNAYEWKGAAVTAWLWEAGLASLDDALPIFKDGIIQGKPSVRQRTIYLRCKKRVDWRRRVPGTVLDRTGFPHLPEASVGIPLPAIYGGFQGEGFDEPWTAAYPVVPVSAKTAQNESGGAGLVVPGVVVDSGVGGEDARVLFAEHELKELGSIASGIEVFVSGGDRLGKMQTPNPSLLADKSGFDLKDEENVARIGVPCIDVRVTGTYPNLAVNPRAALDVFDPASFARISSDGSHDRLTLVPGNPGQPGKMVGAEFVIAYRCSHTTTSAAVRYSRPETPGGTLSGYTALTAHASAPAGQPVIERIAMPITDPAEHDGGDPIPAGYVTTDWNLGAGDLEAGMSTPQAGHWFDVAWMAIVIAYEPSQSLVTPEQFVDPGGRGPIGMVLNIRRAVLAGRQPVIRNGIFGWLSNPAIYENEGLYFANLQGRPDDAGTVTGTVDELIELPADIIRDLLERYALETGNVETAIDGFGSFARARVIQNSIEGNPIALAVHVGTLTHVGDVIERVASQAPALCYLSRFDDKWRIVPWLRRPAVADFPRRLEPEDILDIEVEDPAETHVEHDVRVEYAFDHFRRRFAHRCTVGPDGSDGGWSGRGRRDQILVVSDAGATQNNRLDIRRASTLYAPALTAGTYTPAQAMVELKARLAALAISGAVWNVAWGGTVVVNHNDRLDVTMNAATWAVQLGAGLWEVVELATIVQDALQAVDSGLTVPRCGVGMLILEGFNDQLDFNDGTQKKVTIPPGWYRSGAQLAVAIAATLNSQSTNWTASYDSGTKKFTIGRSSGTCQLLCATGPTAAQSAYPALGFSHAANRTGAASYVADYARNRGRFHIQGKAALTLLCGTGANRANGAWVTLGFDYDADTAAALNHEGDHALQDETFALAEATAFELLWNTGSNAAVNAADLLGFGSALDDAAALRHRADRRRGDRELKADESREWYGEKEQLAISGSEIRATEVALNLRDVVFDLRYRSPLRLRVKTHRFPDLELGRVIATGDLSSILALPPRYQAGEWEGKLWWLVEAAQHSGRAWHQELVFVEVTNPLRGARAAGADGVTGTPGPTIGTAFVVFADNRAGSTFHAYAVRIDPTGGLPWTLHGVQVGGAGFNVPITSDEAPEILVDGIGDVLIAWSSGGIRVQKLNASGVLQWGGNSVVVSTGSVLQFAMCSDADGGAYVVWQTSGVSRARINRIDGSGAFPAGWLLGGHQVVTVATDNPEHMPRVIPDGSGGAIVTFHSERVDSGAFVFTDIWAQRFDAAGNRLWGAAGVQVCNASNTQEDARAIPDGSGGCFIVWRDYRSGSSNSHIFAHHVLANGTLDPLWTSTGNPICQASGHQLLPVICSDGAGGFIAAWLDERGGAGSTARRIFAQRMNAAGVRQWTLNGVNAMLGGNSSSDEVQILPDGSGGAFLVTTSDTATVVRTQRLNSAGAAQWGADGMSIGSGANARSRPQLALDGVDGIVCIWEDGRNAGNAFDLYGQRVTGAGVALWTAGGQPIVQRTADQRWPHIASV